jgi:hypothetical protein
MSWKITHLRPPVRTYSVPSNCQHAFGAGYTNRRYEARGFFFGSTRATPASRKILASDAVDGTGVIPRARIFSCTLIGPWSNPDCSNAARTPTACRAISSVSFDGLAFGRLERGSNAAAGPSAAARFRIA